MPLDQKKRFVVAVVHKRPSMLKGEYNIVNTGMIWGRTEAGL